MHKPRAVYGYCRVSGDEQARHGTSLEAQGEEIRAWCAARSYPKPRVFSEVASGSRERLDDRVRLAELLSHARAGDLIVVSRVDRWSRDLVHAVDSIRTLVRTGVRFFAIGESCDPATTQGDQMLGIMAWAADAERQRIKDRTVGTRKRLRDAGFWVEGPAPYGFRIEGRRLVVDKKQARVVRRIFEHALTHSLSATWAFARRLDPEHSWDRGNMYRALRQRWYLGEMKDSAGQWVRTHEGIVDADLFARVDTALISRRHAGPKPRTPRTNGWLMRGIASCAMCGRRMGAAYSGGYGGGGGRVSYYACAGRIYQSHRGKCDAPYVAVLEADEKAAAATLARLRELHAKLSRPIKHRAEPLPDGAAEVAKLSRQRERLIDMATAGRITASDMSSRMTKIEARLGELEAEKAAAARARAAMAPDALAELLSKVRVLEQAWGRASVPVRRDTLRNLAARIALSVDGPRIEWLDIAALGL